ncbi:hypothetical protein TorRG33x02_105010 [Trema orientale]|uniref:Uncharacterized protein n=1 Tax=Trema orientale TaxID=63057 RepID=A0A2P5F7L5_TREOI|nr:hypothetical protein TorRG33x02_105010 [Trema orientale]
MSTDQFASDSDPSDEGADRRNPPPPLVLALPSPIVRRRGRHNRGPRNIRIVKEQIMNEVETGMSTVEEARFRTETAQSEVDELQYALTNLEDKVNTVEGGMSLVEEARFIVDTLQTQLDEIQDELRKVKDHFGRLRSMADQIPS